MERMDQGDEDSPGPMRRQVSVILKIMTLKTSL